MKTAEDDRLMKFHIALAASGRSSEILEADDVYGWLVGSWELDVRHYWAVDVSAQGIKGEVHAGWVLEGRAVQDVWIMPRRGERSANLDKNLNMFGTTLRVWDSSIRAWRITWSNPAGEHFEEQIGRWNNHQIIQVGMHRITRPRVGGLPKSRASRSIGSENHWHQIRSNGNLKESFWLGG